MKLIEKLRETWKKANDRWEDLSYRFDIASIYFEGSKRRVYLKDGRELLPFDDGSTKVIGITNPDMIAEMVTEGLIAHDAEVWIIPKRAPVLEKIVETRHELEESTKTANKESRVYG
ncbi:MAG TPA: hypothetical protein VGS11_10780 [Candidatus Bathyarchaeia archaeon]|nr:hypothetical protein [Candidatus Bathyarchaeia archaeon]